VKYEECKERAMRKTTSADQEQERAGRGLSRRDFLKGALATAGSLAAWGLLGGQQKVLASNAAGSLAGNPERFGMLTDFTRCIGCRRCEAACNKANSLPAPAIPFDDKRVFEQKRRTSAGVYSVVNRYADPKTGLPVYRKIQCNHCAEPACASACPVGALKKSPEGPVIYYENKCIGCRYCMTACPFYIPTFEYSDPTSPAIQKCFMCYQRITRGEIPACAVECPVEAIAFGKRNEMLTVARARIASEPNRYIDHIYGETEVGGTDWLYISGVPFETLGFPQGVGSTAYPDLTKEFLSNVPLVLIALPALLGGISLFSNRRVRPPDEVRSGKGGLK
jgi:formate dehydrogenase iron-sulfur subunit